MADDRPRLWVASSAYDKMLNLGITKHPMETGGMLLGYVADNHDAVVTKIVGPGPNAKHSRYRFIPDGAYQQSILEEHFRATEGRETYLGDWHTHPNGKSSLSRVDIRTLATIANEPRSGTQNPLMAILAGGGAEDWHLSAVRFMSAKRLLFRWEYKLLDMFSRPF